MKTLVLVAIFLAIATAAEAVPQNAQRISGGLLFPTYVINTGTNQTKTQSSYVSQTQFTPIVPSTSKMLFRPTP